MACKTKKVLNTSSSEIEKVQTTSENKTENKIEKTQQKQETKKVGLVDQKKESQTEIEIKGKAETDKPIELYNIENGDTLQTIKVTGNADVSIRTKTNKSDQIKKESSSESLIEKFKEFSENIVEENNIKERVHEMKNKSKEATTRTGTFWSFGLIGGLGAFALLLIATFIYFKNYRK